MPQKDRQASYIFGHLQFYKSALGFRVSLHQNHGFPALFFGNINSFNHSIMPGKRETVMKEIKKVRKEIDDLEWKLRNDVVPEEDVPDIKKKIEDLKKVIKNMLETLPGMK